MEKEIWKDIPEYEGLYQASNLGRIRSLAKKRKNGNNSFYYQKDIILKQQLRKNGYLYIFLWKENNKKQFSIHRLVATTFISNKTKNPQVNHKDGNKLNNNIDNLEWCTVSYNNKEAYRIGIKKPTWLGKKGAEHPNYNKKGKLWFSSKPVLQYDLNNNFIKEWECSEQAKEQGKYHHVSECCRGKRKTSNGYMWKYKN